MTDIRQRLISAAETARSSQFGAPASICMEAAVEIWRLRNEVAEWKQAAGVEANLRREFLARAEAAEVALSQPEPTEAHVEAMARAAFEADWPKDDWARFKSTDHVPERYRKIVRAALRAMPLQDHVWQPIKTAAPRREVWLFTPGRRLGSDAADDIRFECPANWTWATMWMPAIIPAPPMEAEERTRS